MVRTEADADKAGLRHIQIEAKIAKAEADYKVKAAALKEKFNAEVEPLKKENRKILEEVGDWALTTDTRDEGTKGQITLSHCRITIRESDAYKYPTPLTKVIQQAKKLDLGQFIRTKEEVNKDRIRDEATPEQLSALGIKVTRERQPYIEPIQG